MKSCDRARAWVARPSGLNRRDNFIVFPKHDDLVNTIKKPNNVPSLQVKEL